MQIDRSNYEIWIIDWLDGNLNSSQVAQLNLFLDQNPDLREEFNDLTHPKLLSPGITYKNKENLKKSPSDITQAQFEYLCAAYLEHDLTKSQKEEVEEIINKSPDRKKTFDLIQKTKIIPERTGYKYKKRLRKQTTYNKVIWLSVKGLSIAAAISLLIVVYSVLPSTTSSEKNKSARNLVADSLIQRPPEILKDNRFTGDRAESYEKKSVNSSRVNDRKNNITAKHDNIIAGSADPSIRKTVNHEISVDKIPVYSKVDINKAIAANLIIHPGPKSDLPATGDENKHAGRFIPRTIREKILKTKAPPDTPLKGYEIAEAGVSGLNKLLGWQMALDMKKDGNGQPQSVSFSSGILKIQAPVKKREPQP